MVEERRELALGRSGPKIWAGVLVVFAAVSVKPLTIAITGLGGANFEGTLDIVTLVILIVGIVLIIRGARKVHPRKDPAGYSVPLAEFARVSGVSENVLMEQIRNGQCDGEIVDKEWYVHERELDKFSNLS